MIKKGVSILSVYIMINEIFLFLEVGMDVQLFCNSDLIVYWQNFFGCF